MKTTEYRIHIQRIARSLFARYLPLLGLILLLLVLGSTRTFANLGTEFINLPDAYPGSMAFGDYDGDGDLDLALGGQIYTNNGIGFSFKVNLPKNGNPAWGDYDGDGDLDLALGYHIYENQDGELKWKLSVPETDDWWYGEGGRGAPRPAWVDWDGDGDLDLSIDGKVYPNLGSLIAEQAAVDVGSGSMAWGDWDLDGDLDLAFAPNPIGLDSSTNQENFIKLFDNSLGLLTPIWEYPITATEIAWTQVRGGDLAVSYRNTFYEKGHFLLFQNQSGELSLLTEGGEGTVAQSMAWADSQRDGAPDMAFVELTQFTAPDVSNATVQVKGYGEKGSWVGPSRFAGGWHFAAQPAWGDVDGDRDLDLAAPEASPRIFVNSLNPHKRFFSGYSWTENLSHEPFPVSSAAIDWCDFDLDGDLELVFSTSGIGAEVWDQVPGGWNHVWTTPREGSSFPQSVQCGDYDNDGYPDLAVDSYLYRNLHGDFERVLVMSEPISWMDFDNDGDLDIISGGNIYENYQGDFTEISLNIDVNGSWVDWDNDSDPDLLQGNTLYENQLGQFIPRLTIASEDLQFRMNVNPSQVSWGDYDGDGDYDLAVGGGDPLVFQNRGNTFSRAWQSPIPYDSQWVRWVDLEGDGDLDLVASHAIDSAQAFRNDSGTLSPDFRLGGSGTLDIRVLNNHIAWADWDQDGDLDFAQSVYNDVQRQEDRFYTRPRLSLYRNQQYGSNSQQSFRVTVDVPQADHNSRSSIISSQLLPIHFSLHALNNATAGTIKVYYSPVGSGQWLPATPTKGTKTRHLAAGPNGIEHIFLWDTAADGLFGLYNDLAVRVEVYYHPDQVAAPGTYQYTNQTLQSLVEAPKTVATTQPFRFRGTQVRVLLDNGQPAVGATVLRQKQGEALATPIGNGQGGVFTTDSSGYLQGRGELLPGDKLIALAPVEIDQQGQFTLYHTNASVTAAGLSMHNVTAAGPQTIIVSPDNPLLLFNLIVSLEWDARLDTTFMSQLQADLRRTSEILYDLTNGQAAIGDVHVYHDKGHWGVANVVIPAANNVRPSATLGGIVSEPLDDIDRNGQTIEMAYVPGQIRIGPTWNRFGNPSGTLGEDWPRTLAHELGHYLFHVPDNYLGLGPNDELRIIDCQGSVMTDPYRNEYSEFLRPSEWTGECLDSLASRYLGRSDWETITRFYPALSYANESSGNPGPPNLPFEITDIRFFDPPSAPQVLAAPIFNIQDADGQPLAIPDGRSQAFLLKTQRDVSGPTGSYAVALGSAVGNLVNARGAEPGDRLCIFDFSRKSNRIGCQIVEDTSGPVLVHEVPDWEPTITVTGVNTDTVRVVVDNVGQESRLSVQLLPALGAASDEVSMARAGNRFEQEVTAPDGAFYGHVRVWVPGVQPTKEMIVAYANLEAWEGYSYAWGGYKYAWGSPPDAWGGYAYAWGGYAYAWGGYAYAWGAPVMSGDGQVMIFPLDSLFGAGSALTLQSLPQSPNLYSWLTPVGQAYRLKSIDGSVPRSSVVFRYLGADVPAGQEENLNVYFSPDDGETWQRLVTDLDTYRNHASTNVEGEGIYVLVSTVELPAFVEGWNTFSYPVPGARPVEEALASITDKYTSVYHFANGERRWQLFDTTVNDPFRPLVNTLAKLEFPKVYWIYSRESVSAFLPVGPTSSGNYLRIAENSQVPPATFYGWVMSAEEFNPQVGMPVTAEIDGQICGESTIVEHQGRLAYVVQVSAESNGKCGRTGKSVVFRVDGDRVVGANITWDNSQGWNHPLAHGGLLGTSRIFLPLQIR